MIEMLNMLGGLGLGGGGGLKGLFKNIKWKTTGLRLGIVAAICMSVYKIVERISKMGYNIEDVSPPPKFAHYDEVMAEIIGKTYEYKKYNPNAFAKFVKYADCLVALHDVCRKTLLKPLHQTYSRLHTLEDVKRNVDINADTPCYGADYTETFPNIIHAEMYGKRALQHLRALQANVPITAYENFRVWIDDMYQSINLKVLDIRVQCEHN
jgi:hypothetical protein